MTSVTKRTVNLSEKTAPDVDDVPTFTPPNFTVKEILGAIPKQCFERSAFWSSAYLLRDFVMVSACVYGASQLDTLFGKDGNLVNGSAGQALKAAGWVAYWFLQGLICTGIWVIAHECGHQAYSPSKLINNTVGWFLHSALLVPYHSWRISHARHHAATGHMTRDEVFVPKTAAEIGLKSDGESTYEKLDEILDDAPIWVLFHVLVQQLFGWPAYLIRNASGQRHYPKFTNHFDPQAVIFDKRHFSQVVVSDIGIALTVTALVLAAKATSVSTVVCYYGIPYLLVNHWLVMITFLQHTDPMLPHYRENTWNFQRGALCTQDRDVFNFFTHDIASTHVAHHLKSSIPFYHGREATEALKKFLGPHYMYTSEHWLVSLYKSYAKCRFVDDEGDVVFFRDAQGKVSRKVQYDNDDSGVEVL